jgi:hypothetical protein
LPTGQARLFHSVCRPAPCSPAAPPNSLPISQASILHRAFLRFAVTRDTIASV